MFFIANRLYFPSYVSLQSALSLYGFIPEGVFSITSISTRINRKFETPIGDFIYKNLREDLYFGFTLHKTGQFYYRLATPEKAVLDFLYLYPQYKDAADMEGLRWNIFEIDEKFDFKLAEQYLKIYDSAALSRRYAIFVDFVKNEL